ncbi:MAG: hypothetical protein MUC90_02490 [Thermoplasmata archaeon]|nr:hypothetical protein [Thermoplasmata archaeon]
MVSMSSLHSLTAELHSGALTLAFICIVAVAVAQVVVAHKKLFGPKLSDLAVKVRGYAEATGYVAAVGGLIGLLLSAWTGMYAWPQEDLLLSEEVRNKITLTVFATVLWGMVVFIRMRFGRGLWACPAMATVYTLIAVAAMSVTGATGSVGAHLTKGESLLDPLWNMLNVTITESFVLEPSVAGGIALFTMIGLVLSLVYARRAGLFDVKLAPETCQRYFKWDEPVIPPREDS